MFWLYLGKEKKTTDIYVKFTSLTVQHRILLPDEFPVSPGSGDSDAPVFRNCDTAKSPVNNDPKEKIK